MSLSVDVSTYSVSSPPLGSESPRKRSRSSDLDDHDLLPDLQANDDDSVSSAIPTCVSLENAVRDEDYYFPDGSCIVLVENILFNVHRSILSRDSSSFSTLFTLPQGEQIVPDGTTDENPIVLYGDTAREFRHFLWALYSMPHELKDLHRSRSNIPKLVDIVHVSVKYSFKSLETWACDILKACIARRPFPLREANTTERAQLIDIMRLAQLCQHKRLLDGLVSSFQELLTSSPGYNELALLLVDELEPPALKLTGAAYFSALLRGPEFWDTPEMCAAPHRRLRILNGYYHLTSLWEIFCKNPPRYTHSSACLQWSYSQCEARWHASWKEHIASDEVMSLNPADVVGRLKAIATSLGNEFKPVSPKPDMLQSICDSDLVIRRPRCAAAAMKRCDYPEASGGAKNVRGSVVKSRPHRPDVQLGAETERLPRGRVRITNVWCTLDVKHDIVSVRFIYPDRDGSTFSAKYNQQLRWYYLSDQRPDEVKLIESTTRTKAKRG
ncbi:hypothetical protein M0805_007492 [Coniferiporia weirii]|nr:hypothetical protein M0805_007492 [Coniferiporia weirii]